MGSCMSGKRKAQNPTMRKPSENFDRIDQVEARHPLPAPVIPGGRD